MTDRRRKKAVAPSVPYGRKVGALAIIDNLASRQATPVATMLQLTQRCNFRCRHCYQTHPRRRELTTSQWMRVMEELAASGVLFLTFSGGEPLLRKDFVDLARRARELRFALKVKTNGWNISRPMADVMGALPVLEVHLSLYSTDARVHDSITGMSGSHRRVMSAGRMLVRRKVGVLMNVPLMNVNVDAIDDIIGMCDREGFGWTMDPHLNVCEDGRCNPRDLRMTDEQMLRVFGDSRIFDREAVAEAAARRTPDDRVCNAGRTSSVITPTGDVLPCPLLQIPMGNVLEKPFAEIWTTSEDRRELEKITWGSLRTCPDCEFMPWCVRCHGAAQFEEGDHLGPSRVACQAARLRRLVCLGR